MGINFPKFIFCVLYSWMSDTSCVHLISPFKEQVYFYFNSDGYESQNVRNLASKWGKKMFLFKFYDCPSQMEAGKFCGYVWIAFTSSSCRNIFENISDLITRHLTVGNCTLFTRLEAKLKNEWPHYFCTKHSQHKWTLSPAAESMFSAIAE